MVSQVSQAPSAGSMRPRRGLPAVAAALAGALALGAAFVALDGGSSSRTEVERAAPPAPAAVAVTAPAAERVPVYLVASAEEAVELGRRLTVLAPGGTPQHAELLVAGSAEEEARAQIAINALQGRLGAGRVAVVDMRAPRAAAISYMPSCDGTSALELGISAC